MSNKHEYVLVALTGSIGAGKSAVADVFRECGIPVLSADALAKELMQSDPQLMSEIRAEFGDEAYHDNGELNRSFIADKIFHDPELLSRMNEMVHPRTIAAQGVRAMKLIEQGNKVVACEAALTLETGGEGSFDYIVVVDADKDIRYARAAERDGVSIDEVARRDAMQMPANEKVERADFVIRNNGTPEELRASATLIAQLLKSLPPRDVLDADEVDVDGNGASSDE